MKINKDTKKNLKMLGTLIFVFLLISTVFDISYRSQDADAEGLPFDVSWNINNYFSNQYQIEELRFVWGGDTGTSPDPTTTFGSLNNGRFDTQYNEYGVKSVQAYAINSAGDQVSAVVQCDDTDDCGVCFDPTPDDPDDPTYECDPILDECFYDLGLDCNAYASADAVNPILFFDPSTDEETSYVYWRVDHNDNPRTLTYHWSDEYIPSIVDGKGGTGESYSNIGPFVVNDLSRTNTNADYQPNNTYLSTVVVRDLYGSQTAECTMKTKECNNNDDCITLGYGNGATCDLQTFRCIPPVPVLVYPIYLDPAVVRDGEVCGISWAVDNVDSCILYKDNVEVDISHFETSTTTAGLSEGGGLDDDLFAIDPGAYSLTCVKLATEQEIHAGPVRCIYNPEVKEQ